MSKPVKKLQENMAGTGLGLSIVKKLLNLMGSEIHLKSQEDIGTTFSFEIDFKIDPEFNMVDPAATRTEIRI